jgi:hypothetical protein
MAATEAILAKRKEKRHFRKLKPFLNPLDAKPFSRISAKGLFSNLFTVTYQCKTSEYMT